MKERRFLAEILLGFIRRDYRRVARGAFRGRLCAAAPFGRGFRAGASAPSASRSTTAAPMRSRWRSCSRCCSRSRPCSTWRRAPNSSCCRRPWWWSRASARNLDPKLDMWRTAEPVVRDWIERHLGPVGRIEEAGRGLATLAGVIADLPELALRAERRSRQARARDRSRLLARAREPGRHRPGRGPPRALEGRGAVGDRATSCDFDYPVMKGVLLHTQGAASEPHQLHRLRKQMDNLADRT